MWPVPVAAGGNCEAMKGGVSPASFRRSWQTGRGWPGLSALGWLSDGNGFVLWELEVESVAWAPFHSASTASLLVSVKLATAPTRTPLRCDLDGVTNALR